MNQALIDEIVSGVLAQLQPAPSRPVRPTAPSAAPAAFSAVQAVPRTAATVLASPGSSRPVTSPVPQVTAMPVTPAPVIATPVPVSSVTLPPATASKPAFIELTVPIITAEVLEQTVRAGQSLRIGRSSILTPSARDWLNTKRTPWSRQDKGGMSSSSGSKVKWQVILQTMTPTVRSLQEGLRRMTDGWKIELVGQPLEAAALATNLVSTAECDGVVIFTEQAELIVCKANRHERVRAAVMQNAKQWEQVMRTLSANVVCISPIGKTFIELRNLLRDCAATRPRPPAGL